MLFHNGLQPTFIKRKTGIKGADKKMEQKGMTFDQDFFHFILFFSSLSEKKGKEKLKSWSKVMPYKGKVYQIDIKTLLCTA